MIYLYIILNVTYVNLIRRQSSTQKAARAITDGTRNLYILVTMVLSFVVFWYPLFLLTIIDVFVKAEVNIDS